MNIFVAIVFETFAMAVLYCICLVLLLKLATVSPIKSIMTFIEVDGGGGEGGGGGFGGGEGAGGGEGLGGGGLGGGGLGG